MKSAYQLLSLVARYKGIANTFHFYPPHVVYCRLTAPSGRSWHVATDFVEG